MSGIEKIIEEAESLPVQERLKIVDSLAIDLEWGKVAESRLEELGSGHVKAIPGKRVIKNIQTHLK